MVAPSRNLRIGQTSRPCAFNVYFLLKMSLQMVGLDSQGRSNWRCCLRHQYVEGGTAVLHSGRGTGGWIAALNAIARVPAERCTGGRASVGGDSRGWRKRGLRSLLENSRCAQDSLRWTSAIGNLREGRRVSETCLHDVDLRLEVDGVRPCR